MVALLHSINNQMAELITEIRHLRGMGVTAQSAAHSHIPLTINPQPVQTRHPIVGEPVQVGGPPHSPIFRCPIDMPDGNTIHGPEAPNKSLAKFLATQQVSGGSHQAPYKPTVLTQLYSLIQPGSIESALFLLFLNLVLFISFLILYYYRGISNAEAHAQNGNGDLVEVLNHSLNGEITTKYDDTPGSLFKPIESAKRVYNNLTHDYNIYKHQQNENQAHHFAQEQLHQYLADRRGEVTTYNGYDEGKKFFPRKRLATVKETPAPPLVGVETNPGPPKRHNKGKRKGGQKAAAKVVKAEAKAISHIAQATKNLVRVTQPKAQPRRSRNNGYSKRTVSDGINQGMVVVNNANVSDKFHTRREKIMDVTGTSAFTIATALTFNPGNSVLFKIFSNIAATYEMWELVYARFVYESDAYSSTGTTNSPGLVFMAFDPDVDDPLPANSSQIENFSGSVKGPPFSNMKLNVNSKVWPIRKHFVNYSANAIATRSGTKFYDGGTFILATYNNATTTIIGELFIEYSFVLRVPTISPYMVPQTYCHLLEGPAGTASSAAPFGSSGAVLGTGATFNPSPYTTSYFTMPIVGEYMIFTCISSTADITVGFSPSLGANVSLVVAFQQESAGTFGSTCVTNTRKHVYCMYVRIAFPGNGVANRITYTGSSGITSGNSDTFIFPWDPFIGGRDPRPSNLIRRVIYDVAKQDPEEDEKDQRERLFRLEQTLALLTSKESSRPNPFARHIIQDERVSESEYDYADIPSSTPVARAPIRTGPTNREMHALNGNGSQPQGSPPPTSGGGEVKISTDVAQDWVPGNTNPDDPYHLFRGRRVYVTNLPELKRRVMRVVMALAANPTSISRSSWNSLCLLAAVTTKVSSYMYLQFAVVFKIDVTGVVAYQPPAPILVGVEPNPGPDDSFPVSSTVPIVKKRPRELCSECGHPMFHNTKYQRYICQFCTKYKPGTTQPLPPPAQVQPILVTQPTPDYSTQPAKKRAKVSGTREYFRVNAKGKFKHAEFRLKKTYSQALKDVKEGRVHVKTEPVPKITTTRSVPEPVVHQKIEEKKDPPLPPSGPVYPLPQPGNNMIGKRITRTEGTELSLFNFDPRPFLRYTQDADGNIDYSKPSITIPGEWHPPLQVGVFAVLAPTTLLDELCMDAHRLLPHTNLPNDARKKIEEESYSVLVNLCYTKLNVIGNVPSHLMLFCAMWFPRLAWDRIYKQHQLANPLNNLPFNTCGVGIRNLPLFENSDFAPRDFMRQDFIPSLDQQDRYDENCVQCNREIVACCDSRYKRVLRYLFSMSVTDTKVKPQVDHFMQTERIIHGLKPDRTKRLGIKTSASSPPLVVAPVPPKPPPLADSPPPPRPPPPPPHLSVFTNMTPIFSPAPVSEVMSMDIEDSKSYKRKRYSGWGCNQRTLTINADLYEPLNPVVHSQISGNSGSWTNEDDVHSEPFYQYQLLKRPRAKDKSGYHYSDSRIRSRDRVGTQYAYVYNHPHSPICFANTMENEEATMVTRVVVDTPKPDLEFMYEFVAYAKKHFHAFMNYKVRKIKPVSNETYLQRSNASPSVKKILAKTMEELKQHNVGLHTVLTKRELVEWTTRALFLKQENLCYRSPLGIKEKAGRAISAADPKFISITGPFFMALQDHIKHLWDAKNWLCFVSGVNAKDAASVINMPWTLVEDDIGTFDSSVSQLLLSLEVWITKQFGAPDIILKLMLANNRTHGYTAHGAKYWCKDGRKSGDPFTSLYNSILNGLMHAFIIHKNTNWTVPELKENVRMVVAGDDNVMAINYYKHIDFVGAMLNLGFNSEALYRQSIHDVEFCSCRVYESKGVYFFGPMPGKVLSKLGYINNPPPNVTRESMVRGIMLGLKKLCYYLPPIQHLVDRVLYLTSASEAYLGKETWIKGFEWQMSFTAPSGEAVDRTAIMTSLFNTYGYTPEMDYQWSQTCKRMYLDAIIQSPVFHMLCDRDTAAPQAA